MKRFLCFLKGHNVLPTGRRGLFLAEWRCVRCEARLVSYREGEGLSYCGLMFPRAKYEGLLFTVFPADRSSDRAMMEIKEVNDLLNPGWDLE